jgi:tetratricopeptide (TPR) repeat protein
MKAEEAALQAVALDHSLAQAHEVLGYVAADVHRDLARAENECKRTIELGPDYAMGHMAYAWLLLQMGRFDEAKKEANQALRLDAVDSTIQCAAANVFGVAGESDKAVGFLREALNLDPNCSFALVLLRGIHEEKGQLTEAIELSRRTAIAFGRDPQKAAQQHDDLQVALSTAGARGYWQKRLELARLEPKYPPCDFAVIYLHLGDLDSMFKFLAEAQQDSWPVVDIYFDRCWDSVRSDPRFQALRRKLGLEK